MKNFKTCFTVLAFALLFAFSAAAAHADTWNGKAQINSAQLGAVGSQLPLAVSYDGFKMHVALSSEKGATLLTRDVDLQKYPPQDDSDSSWESVCVPQTDGTFEVYEWAGYEGSDAYLNYRFSSKLQDCDSGTSDFEAFYMTQAAQ